MKYANIVFKGKEYVNLGDNLQLLAIDNLYKSMGIEEDEIIKIPYNELRKWHSPDGEKVLLPINFPFLEYAESGFAGIFSTDIIPVFLGLTILKTFLTNKEVQYFHEYEPIGCRDEHTYKLMNKYGIKAWLNGCMTLTMFPFRDSKKREQIYLVDVPKEVEENIPCDDIKRCIRETQIVSKKEIIGNIDTYVINRFKEYSENAALIITTRLHCAVPCIGMGIPVVLVLDNISFRFSWIDKICPIYKQNQIRKVEIEKEYNLIDVSKIKNIMLENATNLLLYNKSKDTHAFEKMGIINSFWINRKKNLYYIEGFSQAKKYLIENHRKEDEFEYAVWGITVLAEMICEFIGEYFPKAELVDVYDKNRIVKFNGLFSRPIEEGEKQKIFEEEVFVTAWAATEAAKFYFNEIEKIDRFCLCYQGEFSVNSKL